jgi:hypothetical protein
VANRGVDLQWGFPAVNVEPRFHGPAGRGQPYLRGSQTINNGRPGLMLHDGPHGLMASQWTFLDRHSAGAWNRIAGHRATAGNFNEPANIGEYLYDLPRENDVVVQDSAGRPLPGARVSIYQSTEPPDERGVYAKYYDDRPDIEVRADGEGRVRLGTNPFAADGRFVHSDGGYSNVTAIVRVEHEGRVGYGFLEAAELNHEYWRGHTDLGRYTLRVPQI